MHYMYIYTDTEDSIQSSYWMIMNILVNTVTYVGEIVVGYIDMEHAWYDRRSVHLVWIHCCT